MIGEYKLRISHSLVALPGTSIHDVTEVNSHPIALMQCTDFLDTLPNAKVVEKEDTAMSARWIAENKLEGHAAICGKLAAQIASCLVGSEMCIRDSLSILSFYDMNLSKVQSLPIIGREWEYLFYIDLTFTDYTRYRQALDAIIPLTKDLKILGEYAEGKQSV